MMLPTWPRQTAHHGWGERVMSWSMMDPPGLSMPPRGGGIQRHPQVLLPPSQTQDGDGESSKKYGPLCHPKRVKMKQAGSDTSREKGLTLRARTLQEVWAALTPALCRHPSGTDTGTLCQASWNSRCPESRTTGPNFPWAESSPRMDVKPAQEKSPRNPGIERFPSASLCGGCWPLASSRQILGGKKKVCSLHRGITNAEG